MLEDSDVLNEEKRIQRSVDGMDDAEAKGDGKIQVKINKVRKVFNGGEIVAVNNVSYGLEYGECFALLGVNGAGKTTTFKCLTGEEVPSSGSIEICGNNILT
jgi:ATP-binding cassette subfamily A (ABC1) protein 3